MVTQDTSQLKQKIISLIRFKGPSLPVHAAKETETTMLFASAFLSELISEKRLKVSKLKVGGSPLYFIPGQEPLLEKFTHHLNPKEKEAFILLKEKRILKDSDQHPAIRVALKEINDFAIPFKKDDEIYWKYLTTSDQEILSHNFVSIPKPIVEVEKEVVEIKEEETDPLIREVKKQFGEEIPEKPFKEEEIPEKQIKKKAKKKAAKKKASQKKNDKFFNTVKEFLAKKSIEISDIEGFSKNDLTLRVNVEGKEKLLIAYNKKRITEEDIVKAHKKASEEKLEYIVLSLGEPLKKLNNFIEAIKNLSEIEKIE